MDSCIMPISALSTTISTIRPGSMNSIGSLPLKAIMNDTSAAMSSMMIIASLNWSMKRARLDFLRASPSLLGPTRPSISSACARLRPLCPSVPRLERSSSTFAPCSVNSCPSPICIRPAPYPYYTLLSVKNNLQMREGVKNPDAYNICMSGKAPLGYTNRQSVYLPKRRSVVLY